LGDDSWEFVPRGYPLDTETGGAVSIPPYTDADWIQVFATALHALDPKLAIEDALEFARSLAQKPHWRLRAPIEAAKAAFEIGKSTK
jgi:hypothetical protein